MIFFIVIIFCLFIYVCFLAIWNFRLFTLEKEDYKSNDLISLSVVIPFRNEEKTLPFLLDQLKSQIERNPNFEVILIDDHSDDSSFFIVKQFCLKQERFYCFSLDEGLSGKKAALNFGIMNSIGKYIVTTDADCVISELWLLSISTFIAKYNSDLIIMPVGYICRSWFHRLQQIEFYSLQASTAASALSGFPIMCNGANIALSRDLYFDFIKSNEGSGFASGDDMFLLNFSLRCNKKIQYLKDYNAAVFTYPLDDFKPFILQRIRWTGKLKGLRNFRLSILSVVLFFANLYPLILLFSYSGTRYLFISILAFKGLLEYLLIKQYSDFLKSELRLHEFIFSFIFYPFYFLSLALILPFSRRIYWKGRVSK